MPKKNNRDRNVVTVSFRRTLTKDTAMVAGFSLTTTNVDTDLTPRLTTISDTFGLYRFTDLNVRLFPPNAETTAASGLVRVAIGFNSETVDTAPASILALSEYEYVIHNNGSLDLDAPYTVPTPVMRIPRRVLVGDEPNKWWKTKGGAAVEAWEEIQGQLQHVFDCVNTSTDQINSCVEVWGHCEFSQPLNVTNTPLLYPVEIKDSGFPKLGSTAKGVTKRGLGGT
jgi:hypothetical protein